MKTIIYDDSDMIYYDDNVIDSAISVYGQLDIGFDSMSQDINKSGDINIQTGMFGNGISKISRQSNAISKRYNGAKRILTNSKERWMMLESKLKTEISSVHIPTFETLKSTNLNVAYNNVLLNKNDGKAINITSVNFPQEEFASSIKEEQDLNDIKNEEDTSISELDDYSLTDEKKSFEALKTEDLQQTQFDSSSLDTNKQILGNVNNGTVSNDVELDFKSFPTSTINNTNNDKGNEIDINENNEEKDNSYLYE